MIQQHTGLSRGSCDSAEFFVLGCMSYITYFRSKENSREKYVSGAPGLVWLTCFRIVNNKTLNYFFSVHNLNFKCVYLTILMTGVYCNQVS